MNRQTKRLMAKQGADKPRAPERKAQPQQQPTKEKRSALASTSARSAASCKKVAWPTKKEVINSTMVVLIAVVFMTTLIFGLDYVSSKFVLFLFD